MLYGVYVWCVMDAEQQQAENLKQNDRMLSVGLGTQIEIAAPKRNAPIIDGRYSVTPTD
jgi:hypothetical protein